MIYTTGTIAISGNTVTGTGTNFSAPLSLIRVGCTLIAIGNPVQIFTITEIKSGTELSVTPAANPAIPAGTKFNILLSDSISVDGLAQDVAETLRYYQGKETEIAAAVEWWKDFGGDGQMDQLLADIRAETAKSTANAQKTEADKKTTEGYKNAAATSETNAAQSAAALNYRNQAQAIVGTDIGLSANPRDCPDISGNPSGYIGFLRIMEGATGWPSIASGERYLSGFICPTLGSVPAFSGLFIGHITGSAYTYKWSESTGQQWTRHARKDEVSRLYNYPAETQPYAGVIAQEVMEALPEAVGSFTHYGEALQGPTIDGNELREETRYLNVDYAAVTGLLVQVARETDNRVTELEEENASLRANIAVMDERIAKLEALVRQLTGSEE